MVNPTANLDVPHADNKRERFASRAEAAALLQALPDDAQALWATAFYTGLRSGELKALRWPDVDLKDGTIYVRRAWDDVAGEQEPKSRGSTRRVPIIPTLLGLLEIHQERTGRSGSDLVFGRTASDPFHRSSVRKRALAAWRRADRAKAEKLRRPLRDSEALTPIAIHECRHTAASLMIAAGANAKALSVVMGHQSIQITFDRYGHLMPGGESEVGRLLGEYIEGDA